MQNLDIATTPNLFSGHREIMKSIKITRQKYIINQAICSNLIFLIPCFFIFVYIPIQLYSCSPLSFILF